MHPQRVRTSSWCILALAAACTVLGCGDPVPKAADSGASDAGIPNDSGSDDMAVLPVMRQAGDFLVEVNSALPRAEWGETGGEPTAATFEVLA